MAKQAKKGNSGNKKSKARRKPAAESEEHVRQLAPRSAVKSFITEVIATRNATSEAGQGLSTATKRAQDQGVNVPAARVAARIYSKAKQDAIKARVLWEDTVYYLTECLDFDRIAPAGMFTAEESGQRRGKGKQTEMDAGEGEAPKIDNPQHLLDAADELEAQQGVAH